MANIEDPSSCTLGSFSPWSPLQIPGAASITSGEDFQSDPLAPYKGNGIDALPYWSRKLSINVPSWVAENAMGGCFQNEVRGDGASFTNISPDFFSGTVFTKEDRDFVERFALLKASAALRKADASIPMLLKERAETLKMLKAYSGNALDLIRNRQLKDVARWRRVRGSSEKRKFLAQTIANEHLMFVFGMLPLLNDMEGLAKHVMREEFDFITGRGRMTIKSPVNPVFTWYPHAFLTKTDVEHRYSVRCTLRADINVKILGQAQRLGFNPLYTAYDFTPLSFILGWFSNFNFWIQSLDPLYGSTYRNGSLSCRETTAVTRTCHAVPGIPNSRPKGSGSSRGTSTYDVRKVVGPDLPQGELEFYNNFSFFSVTAGISLFVQRKVKLADKAIRIKPFRYKSKKPVYLPPITYTGKL